jgi:hypothetical protein
MVTSSFLKPSGPHHLFACSGSVIAFQTIQPGFPDPSLLLDPGRGCLQGRLFQPARPPLGALARLISLAPYEPSWSTEALGRIGAVAMILICQRLGTGERERT